MQDLTPPTSVTTTTAQKSSDRGFSLKAPLVKEENYGLLLRCRGLLWGVLVTALLSVPTVAFAQAVPPSPSRTSIVGDTVTNPVTGQTTIVNALRTDPAGTPTAGAVAFVETADGYVFLVKTVGERIYNADPTPLGFTIVSEAIDPQTNAKTVQLDADPQDNLTTPLAAGLLKTEFDAQFFSNETPGVDTPPVIVAGATGVRAVVTGRGGTNGRDGAAFVPPTAGGNGAPGPDALANYVNTTNISTVNQIGLEVGSVGGQGGQGGDSYLSFWDGQDGGDGGRGGNFGVINQSGIQVATTGIARYGIFGYSRSGRAGTGGSGFVAPGGGTGGHSSNGGNVSIVNQGNVFTRGIGAFGIYGLSVSNNGGNGGSQWGLVGQSGSGGFGGSGGSVEIATNGTVTTTGSYAHGVLAQSIGGSGGSSGNSGNLLISLLGSPDNGGNGGRVTVRNTGTITTSGNYARGIFAQSLGGGGGEGGFAGGLVAIGGAGSGGGSAESVTVTNDRQGVISTTGLGADGIIAQSIGGSGGAGSNAGGLIAIGGNGARAGNANRVTVVNNGEISTTQNGSRGIVAQSIGGGGGDGGNIGGLVAVGGSGGGGGRAAAVLIQQGGSIRTGGADATGILAQSIGGGGGNGGISGSISAFAGVAVGGNGGNGGNSDQVDVVLGQPNNPTTLIRTDGDRSLGLFAQSIGGGGGTGGGAVQVTGGFGGAVSLAIGGQGGQGGQGSNVSLTQNQGITLVETGGNDASGLLLQSVGGGGGNGGLAVSVAAAGGPVSGSLSAAVGGNGGSAGNGGEVVVGRFDPAGNLQRTGFSGTIVTKGERSPGLHAQSIGGGGGNGGLAVAAAGGGSATFSGSIGVGVGGQGSSGGTGGNVAVGTQGSVLTEKKGSTGLLIQSIGGGGGNGGGAIAAAIDGSSGGSAAIGVTVGGSGAIGGNSGTVTAATRDSAVTTQGEQATGILVQSIGGGGGNGGYSVSAGIAVAGTGAGAINLGLGGNGAGGGAGNSVKANLQSTISTAGKDSPGIVAQSVGGGGGSGGFNVTAALSGASTGSGSVAVGLGGSGAGGGNGATLDLTAVANVTTRGENSTGIIAQSVGGGGGNGGFNVTAALTGAGTGSGAIAIGLGGSAGSGGTSSTVNSTVDADISTSGDRSPGLLVQSVGGGGGNGGVNVSVAGSGAGSGSGNGSVGIGGAGGAGGNSDKVTSVLRGNVQTSGNESPGVVVESVGGGGGNGGINVTAAIAAAKTGSGAVAIGIGGSGGGGGTAADVDSTVIGNVQTIGKRGHGVVAQSVGGGGGNGGINVTGAITAAQTGSGNLAIGVGGFGGEGGNAGNVVNRFTGSTNTTGDEANGVLAQSVGGGGGSGGLNVTGAITAAQTGSGNLAIGVGGFGGEGGNAGNVVNSFTGSSETTGTEANGVVAQSVGGGGGSGGLNVTGAINLSKENGGTVGIGLGGFGGKGGNAGNVTSTVVAATPIRTIGDRASAIVAHSIGGGGGSGGINVTGAVNITGKNGAAIGLGVGGFGGGAGNAGDVTLATTGVLVTRGDEASGLLAQSIGGGGGNGGLNVTGSVSIAAQGGGGKTVAASLGVGGFGGNAGNAGRVDVNHSGSIFATEAQGKKGQNGITAQSIGGGGGKGGINISGGVAYARGNSDGLGIFAGVGGFGGGGGNASSVTVTVADTQGQIATAGLGSGILAQSIGGGGGNGGINVSGGVVSDASLIAGVGGNAGNAGIAQTVTVDAVTDLRVLRLSPNGQTNGANSNTVLQTVSNFLKPILGGSGGNAGLDVDSQPAAGILAQSIGGGGGNGGLNVSGGLALQKPGNLPSLTFGIGGFGGAGASSQDVAVTHRGNIDIQGDWVHGILAQSIGGGGGNGGVNVSGQVNFSDSQNSGGKTDLTIVAGVGGNGGQGANAGNVAVTHEGAVTTQGDQGRGILAQSIGGGGGMGGLNITGVFAKDSSPVVVGVGGSGSGGGNAGSATVTRGSATRSSGEVKTDGQGAHGIAASSIGGGGGDAGMNFIGGVSLNTKEQGGFAAQFAIGGSGGDAGQASTATVTNYSNIETKKDNSYGILSQSIGGGGGNATFNIGVIYQREGKTDKNMGFNLAIGGGIGDGGDGQDTSVLQVGNITTFGKESFGVLSQSIGGGGGNAGLDMALSVNEGGSFGATLGRIGGTGGVGGNVELKANGNILTYGRGAFGLLAQSLGNGGGNSSASSVGIDTPTSSDKPGDSFKLAVGLAGGTGGKAGDVDLEAQGSVQTQGEKAHAIFGQSVGGGGGNAGMATAFGLNTATASLTIGGTGGTGGTGGKVDIFSRAAVSTAGDDSVGILGQSVGGGGGNGGNAISGGIRTQKPGGSVAIGGNGGSGMTSSDVTIYSGGSIQTGGTTSHGILAQSLGGGGGNGGMAINAALWESANVNRLSVAIGGNGGTAAQSGNIRVTNAGAIQTTKARSVGIFGQAIGGGGGNADYVLAGTVAGNGAGHSMSIGIGGSGGTGGSAGSVTISNDSAGSIFTQGDMAHGILAMSIGGGGGNGSSTISFKKASTPGSNAANAVGLQFSLGGSGGSGGTGSRVDVTNAGQIVTQGNEAHGIVAQSIGGGGGNGGMAISGDMAIALPKVTATGTFAVGGRGGDGDQGGDVTVRNTGSIVVAGNKSYGIHAQSVGGGGGNGGMAIALSRNTIPNPLQPPTGFLNNMALGGFGGTGADSGNVLVQHSGSIQSSGDDSYGIFAQAVAGGGGNIAKYAITNPVWMAANFGLATLLGGEGAAGKAGSARIDSTGNITMLGNNSVAQFSQSVNGGGGNVNLFLDFSKQAVELAADGTPKPVDKQSITEPIIALVKSTITLGTKAVQNALASDTETSHKGDLKTQGESSPGAITQSIGGGGGNTTKNLALESNSKAELDVTLGAKDTNDSSGGNVTSDRVGDVETQGNQSQGGSIQSIGGGGGRLLLNVKTVSATDENAAGPSNTTAQVTLGNDPSFNNNGGAVNSNIVGNTVTNGNYSPGLVVQSIGAGGGQSYLIGLKSAAVKMGASDGSTGNGGDVQVTNTGTIATFGKRSDGLVLQSIGGGGGYVITDLDPAAITLSKSANNGGNGGAIKLTQIGDVVVQGEGSIGILAQSLGGGGGVVDRLFMDSTGGAGTSGAIDLALQGNVQARQPDSIGVFAQSRSSSSSGNIAMELIAGKQISAGDRGTAVQFSGGANNTFVNQGNVIAALNADLPDGYAFKGDSGNENITNRTGSTILGNINLGGGLNSITNEVGATMVPGREVFLGGGTLDNRGLISPGGNSVYTTQVTGNYIQAATSQFDVDVDLTNDSIDRLDITQQASLDGLINVKLSGTPLIKPGQRNLVFASTTGGITQQNLRLNAPNSVVTKFTIGSTDKEAFLATDIDFGGFGQLNPNQTAIGRYINQIQVAGSSPSLTPLVTGLFNLTTMAQLGQSYDQLSPEMYGTIPSNLHLTANRFVNNLFTCNDREGTNRAIVVGSCVWFGGATQRYQRDRTTDYFGSDTSTPSISAGVQFNLGKNWFLGLAIGNNTYETDFANPIGGSVIEGSSTQLGISLKKTMGATTIGVGLVGGFGDFSATRQTTFPFNATASSSQDTSLLGTKLRIAHDFGQPKSYIRPMLDFGLSKVKSQGFRETGAGALNLIVAEDRQVNTTISPALEVGGEFKSGKVLIRPRGSIGFTYNLTDPSPTLSAQFEGAPAGVSAFNVSSLADRSYLDLSADVNFVFPNGFSLMLGYLGQHSRNTSANAGQIKFSYSF